MVRNDTKFKKKEKEMQKNEHSLKGRSGRMADSELWLVKRPFPAGEEVFGFYWFHMTRQNLFKML